METKTGGRTVLVTGAAGFIGSSLCSRLVSLGHRVVGYDNLSRGRLEFLVPSVQLVQGDIRDRARLDETMASARPDCVIHLAAMHFIPDCLARPAEALDVNVGGTRHVLDSCRTVDSVRAFMFASTAAVYAPSDAACVEDTTPLAPIEIYGETKVAGEQLVTRFQAETGIPSAILRLFNAIGRNETNAHVVPHVFESLQTSDVIPLGSIEARRDYIDTRDLSEAGLSVLAQLNGLQILNVGTGVAHSVTDIVESLRRILDRPIEIRQDTSRMRPTERLMLVADIGNIRRTTGWTPRITFEESLKDLVKAYRLA
jgi:UDP-glucose 4-epimerase